MEFESLKFFFNNEQTVCIQTRENVESEFITINFIDGKGRVSFSGYDNSDAASSIMYGNVSANDALRLKEITESSLDYFAKIVAKSRNEIAVSFITFNKLPLVENISIGIGDCGDTYESVIKRINDECILKIGPNRFYVYGLHKEANANVFSIVGQSNKYDVILSRRGECGAVLEKEQANEQIWAIRKKASHYRKEDYSFQLRPFNITFNDVSLTSAASEQNKLEMQNFDESSVLARWEKFAEEDYRISVEKIATVGTIKYSLLKHEDGNIYLLGIGEGYQDRFDALKSVASGLGNDLALDLYNSIDEVGTTKRHPRVKVLSISTSGIRCLHDGDFILKQEGFFVVSNAGAEMIYNRRMLAIGRIKSNKAAKPNIMQLIDGKPIHDKPNKKFYKVDDFKKEIMAAFGGRMPNQSQLDAIEVAINTPDFAIIQGPPGCGKTSLINAIDDCLALIDSGAHRKAASLSTAYQRESTKNMVSSKCINGVPVPFISNAKDRIYIEENFIEYINQIRDKLTDKYPEIVKHLNGITDARALTAFVSRFKCETATYESLLFFLDNVFECLGSSWFDEVKELQRVYEVASEKQRDFFEQQKDENLYFIRIIPSSQQEMDDNGMALFQKAKINLELFGDDIFNSSLMQIDNLLKKDVVDYQKVQSLKNEMIFNAKNRRKNDKDVELNKKAFDLVCLIKEKIEQETTHDNDAVIEQYIDAFVNNPIRVRQALEAWITSVAATHQISSDAKAIDQGFDEPEDGNAINPKDNQLVVYNNVLIDEAARSCPPDLIIPIACAKKRIIMVGDHRQLPQFVNDEVLEAVDVEADIKKEMKDVSVFEYLIGTTEKLSANDDFRRFIALNQQYRMPKILGDFIGDNFYPELSLGSPRGNPCDDAGFIQTLPVIANKCMVWCDVPYGRESKVDNRGWKNVEEAITVSKLLYSFLNDENNSKMSIGVISFYRDQVAEIKNQLLNYNIYVKDEDGLRVNDSYKNRLDIDTVDAFQGLERDVIILSMVRSDPSKKFKRGSFGFLRDERHLCVALSRQKKCLVVVGNGSGMLQTDIANSSVAALADYYRRCKKGGEYIEYIEAKDLH